MKICGNAEDVAELRINLIVSFRTIIEQTEGLRITLEHLEGNWQDEGCSRIRELIGELMMLLHPYMSVVFDLCKSLEWYEAILQDEKKFNQVASDQQKLIYAGKRETCKKDADGNTIYNSPVETRRRLDLCQGKVVGFGGTCGLVSCVNLLRLAGVEAEEEEIVIYAVENDLCVSDLTDWHNGGTSATDRKNILNHFGLSSDLSPCKTERIAQFVEEGRGVIISVHANKLWGKPDVRGFHAVVVTSVKKDINGKILGFYLADSALNGQDEDDGFYNCKRINEALTGRPMNVTRIVR